MATSALSPVSVAVYGLLNVSGLTTLATGGVYDDVPQGTAFPYVWYEVQEQDRRGLGTGGLPEVALRVHTFSTYQGMSQAQSINAKVIELLKDQALTVSGYAMCGHVFYDESVLLLDQDLNGVKVNELVALFRAFVEQTA